MSLSRKLIVILLIATGAGILAWPFVRAHLQAYAVLQLASGKTVPAIVGDLVAVPISSEEVTLHLDAGDVRARFYLPEEKDPQHPRSPTLIIFHGVHHLGIDEPRLKAFAAAMASCGIRVLTPELPAIKDYHVGASSIAAIGQSAEWYAQRTGGPVGVMGLSFSGGLALIAATDPVYQKSIKFVFAVGSQDSMSRVVQYYRSGADLRPDGTTELLPAHEYGPLVIEYEYVDDFVPPADVEPIRAVLKAHLYEDKAAEAEAAKSLTDAQKAEAKELMDGYSPRTRAMIAAVSAKHTADMDQLSPGLLLHGITTPVYLLHGEADNIIPSAETQWMATQIPKNALQAVLISRVISHIDMDGKGVGLADQWRLVHLFALVMHAVDSPTGRAPAL